MKGGRKREEKEQEKTSDVGLPDLTLREYKEYLKSQIDGGDLYELNAQS